MKTMTGRSRFATIPYPWRASIDVGTPWPSRFYVRLISQALRYGNPARRRFGRLHVALARTGVPERPVAAIARAWPRREDAALSILMEEIDGAWSRLVGRASELPGRSPGLSVLALQRSAGRTVFVFGEGSEPLLVCKLAEDVEALETEARALERARGSGVAPRYLGRVGKAFVQQVLPGHPLEFLPIHPEEAGDMEWAPQHEEMSSALIRLARGTAHDAAPQELDQEVRAAAEAHDGPVWRRLRSALLDLDSLDRVVLRHGDTSPQNCMVEGSAFCGFVDWERARFDGAPGFDILNAAVALLDHGVGLVNWSEERAVAAFERAWKHSRFFTRAREAARESVVAAGLDESAYELLEIAFFARRLASRLADRGGYATGPDAAARMVEIACAS